MGAPQIIFIILIAMSLGIHLVKHGEHRDNYNFWMALFDTGLTVALLNWGGFFG